MSKCRRGKEAESVSHLSSIFSFSISSEELRGDLRNRSSVVPARGGGRGCRRGRLGRMASGQLGRGHVLIEVRILIVHLLFQLAPPCAGTGVQRLRVLGLDRASMQASRDKRGGEEGRREKRRRGEEKRGEERKGENRRRGEIDERKIKGEQTGRDDSSIKLHYTAI